MSRLVLNSPLHCLCPKCGEHSQAPCCWGDHPKAACCCLAPVRCSALRTSTLRTTLGIQARCHSAEVDMQHVCYQRETLLAAARPAIDQIACSAGDLLAQASWPCLVLLLSSLAQGTHRLYCGLWGIQRPQGGVLGCHIICMAGLANLGLVHSRLAGSPGLGRCSHRGAYSCSSTVGDCLFLPIAERSAGVKAGCAVQESNVLVIGGAAISGKLEELT